MKKIIGTNNNFSYEAVFKGKRVNFGDLLEMIAGRTTSSFIKRNRYIDGESIRMFTKNYKELYQVVSEYLKFFQPRTIPKSESSFDSLTRYDENYWEKAIIYDFKEFLYQDEIEERLNKGHIISFEVDF